MTTSPKVSVIVPIYKAETYLSKCIESLQRQTLDSFEVLLIDDGSPDSSGRIAESYAADDPRLRVFHKPNEGVSPTRQFGLDHARGEYVIHCDPDDWAEPEMLKELWNKAKAENADMVVCDFVNEQPGRVIYCCQKPTALDHDSFLSDLLHGHHGATWNKLVRRECYTRYGVRFPADLSYCEDLYTNCILLRNPIKVAYVEKAFYHYVSDINENSICGIYNTDTFRYDVGLLHKFQQAFRGSKHYEMATASRSSSLIARAFMAHIFTPPIFRELCYPYRRYASYSVSPAYAALYYLACIGWYGQTYRAWISFHALKAWLRKRRIVR